MVDEFFEDLEVAMVRIEGGLFLSKLSLDFRDSSNLLLRLSFNKVSLIRALLFDIVAENLLLSIGYHNSRKLLILLPHRAIQNLTFQYETPCTKLVQLKIVKKHFFKNQWTLLS